MVDYKPLDEKSEHYERARKSVLAGKTCLWSLVIVCFLIAIAIFSYDFLRFKLRHDELENSKPNKIIDSLIHLETNDKNEISQLINGNNNQVDDDDDDDEEYDLEMENDEARKNRDEEFIKDEIKKFENDDISRDDAQLINDQGEQVFSPIGSRNNELNKQIASNTQDEAKINEEDQDENDDENDLDLQHNDEDAKLIRK